MRWAVILLLIPFHAAQAFKIWDEPNYIEFGPNPALSSIIVFFGPFVMQLLFLLAGISMRYALKRRTYAQFVAERIKRLLIPLVFGVLVLVPPMCYLADRFHNDYNGSFFEHYEKFFTVITDMSGADGGFSFGQFWFLLYLFLLSFVLLGVIALQKKIGSARGAQKKESGSSWATKRILFWGILCLGLPLPLFSELLSVGGKSFTEFFYFLFLGYYVFTNKAVTEKLRKYGIFLLAIGIAAGVVRVILFVICGVDSDVINSIVTTIFEWFMVIGLFGAGGRFFNHENALTRFFTAISYPFFSFHFLFVILFQYLLSDILKENTLLLYTIPVLLSYAATILCCQIIRKIPPLCFLVGIKSGKS
ncbi:MAG: acyltransferase family protein [Eubacterium sp.]|nr:acyltransferase family protein [Eubacterium sp.]